MEGYSVTEAASILGVPTERVWELLARGVLSGTAEGETGMRVYLQPRPAPAPPVAEPGRPNGDGAAREPERELSPFRELLTEFRNLTERYGQALLALGEARGEVAALRSRVDLLEARMDLRLPMSAPTPWPSPMPQPTARDTAAAEEPDINDDEPDVAHDAQDADEDRPSRRRRHRRATENFAEALARAEDPTRPELPGAAETAAALAALRADGAAEARGSDSALPRELPAADAIPMADEADQPTTARVEEAESPSAEPPAEPGLEVEPAPAPSDAPDTEPPATAVDEPAVDTPPSVDAPESSPPPEPEPEPDGEPAPEPEPEKEPAPEPEPEPAAAPAPDPGPPAAEEPAESDGAAPITWDPERYSVDIGEPDWFVEDEPPPAAAVGEPQTSFQEAQLSVEPMPSATEAGEAAQGTSTEPAAEPAAAESAPESEETMLWYGAEPTARTVPPPDVTDPGTGADEMEVVGSQPPPATPTPRILPGSRELDEALAALDALAGRTRTAEPDAPTADATGDRAWPTADRPPAAPVSARPAPLASRAAEQPRLPTTPASRAYRRLRRIFPG